MNSAYSASSQKKRQRAWKKHLNQGCLYAWPMGLWFAFFFIAPIVIVFIYSFMKKGLYGGFEAELSLKAYAQMFNPKYAVLVLRTLKIAALSTGITIALALPCGYAMARSRHQAILLFLIIIPFWTNSLIRIFAWMLIMNSNGVINRALLFLHITAEPVRFLYNQGAVILVSVYMYLPYAILPIFTAVDRFDFSLLEAARDLGAGKIKAAALVLIPGIKSGIVSALIFTFIPIFGAYAVSLLVGGIDSYMLGNVIVDQVQKVRNWPLASAFSMVITLVSIAGILWVSVANMLEARLKKTHINEETDASTGMRRVPEREAAR